MNPQAIISAIPILRRAWKYLPPPLRVPVLLVAAAVGVWQFIAGRKAAKQGDASAAGGAQADRSQAWSSEPPPLPRDG